MSALDELAEDIKKKAKEHDKEVSDGEASEAARNVAGFFSVLRDIAIRIKKLNRRLKKEPDGFLIDGPHSCIICGRSIDETTGWYHRGGQRCLICHKAVIKGVVPPFILWAHDSYYSMWKLKDFGVDAPTARRMVKEGRLKARVILKESGRPHEYIFLKKENPELVSCERFSPILKSQKRHQYKWAVRREAKQRQEKIKKILAK
jgi:hypothetical protein